MHRKNLFVCGFSLIFVGFVCLFAFHLGRFSFACLLVFWPKRWQAKVAGIRNSNLPKFPKIPITFTSGKTWGKSQQNQEVSYWRIWNSCKEDRLQKSKVPKYKTLCVVSIVTTGKQELQYACKEGNCDKRDIVLYTFLKSVSALLSVKPAGMAFSAREIKILGPKWKQAGKFDMASRVMAKRSLCIAKEKMQDCSNQTAKEHELYFYRLYFNALLLLCYNGTLFSPRKAISKLLILVSI